VRGDGVLGAVVDIVLTSAVTSAMWLAGNYMHRRHKVLKVGPGRRRSRLYCLRVTPRQILLATSQDAI